MFNSIIDSIPYLRKKKEENKNMIFRDQKSFKDHIVFCYLILQEARVFPLDVSRYIIQTILKNGLYFLNYVSDFDQNGILYYLGTNEKRESYIHPQERHMIECTPTRFYSGNILQAFCYDTKYFFRNRADNIVQNWHYIDEEAGKDILRKDLCMYIRFLQHSVIPVKYTMRHGYPGGHAMRSWNLEATNDKINDAILNSTWVVLDERVEDTSISPNLLSNTASFDLNKADFRSYHTFRIRLTGPNSSLSHYFMMAGFEIYGTLFNY